jgi:hypothetical protein
MEPVQSITKAKSKIEASCLANSGSLALLLLILIQIFFSQFDFS